MIFTFVLAAQVATSASEPVQRREGPAYRIEQAPTRLSASVEVADKAIRALQQRLLGRLQEELHKGGPIRTVSVCRDEAQAIKAFLATSLPSRPPKPGSGTLQMLGMSERHLRYRLKKYAADRGR